MTAVPDVDLEALAERVQRPDEDVRTAARERAVDRAVPPDALGALADLGVWLAGVQGACPPRPLERVRAVVLAADHGVAGAGTSALAPAATAALARAVVAGRAPVAVAASAAGATVRLVDVAVAGDLTDLPGDPARHKVRQGSGRVDVEDATSRDEAHAGLRAGMAVVDEEVDAGADLLVLGHVGVASTTPASALVGLLAGQDASLVTGRGSGVDDAGWMRKCAAVRDTMRRGRPHLGDQVALLAAVGGPDLAAATGFLLQAAARRTPVVLDGLVPAAAALVAQRVAFRAVGWWLAGAHSTEPASQVALKRLSLQPTADLASSLSDGAGGLLAVPLLRTAGALLAELATYEELGVEER